MQTMIRLYGTVRSRAFRCLWMLEECGVPYELVHTDFATEEVRTTAYLALNPNGKVPTLVDDEVVLFESFAINLHLARHYAPSLWPESESVLLQWMMWGMGELEGPHDAANRTGDSVDAERLQRALSVLGGQIGGGGFVLGDRFSVADLNLAAVLMRPQYRRTAREHATVGDWFRSCGERPALARALFDRG